MCRTISVATPHLCYNAKAAMDSTYMNEHGCVPIKFKQVAGHIWPPGHSFPESSVEIMLIEKTVDSGVRQT